MNTQERIHRIATYLTDLFDWGTSSISREDMIEEGVILSDEIYEVLKDREAWKNEATAEVMIALDTIAGVWSSGFDLASGRDFVDDEEVKTVSDVLSTYLKGPKAEEEDEEDYEDDEEEPAGPTVA